MNIDQYRAMVAAEKTQPEQPSVVTPVVAPVVEVPVVEPVVAPVVETAVVETPVVEQPKIVIDGQEYTAEQVKAGFLRNADYTKKTQETARIRREAERAMQALQANPQIVQQLGLVPDENSRLNEELQDQLVQREVELLTMKYPDFNVQDVLQIATTRRIASLEDAYHISKAGKPIVPPVVANQVETPQLNIEEVKRQIREELLREMTANQSATQTIITPNDAVTPSTSNDEIVLTESELDFCRKSRTDVEQYKKDKLRLIKQRK